MRFKCLANRSAFLEALRKDSIASALKRSVTSVTPSFSRQIDFGGLEKSAIISVPKRSPFLVKAGIASMGEGSLGS